MGGGGRWRETKRLTIYSPFIPSFTLVFYSRTFHFAYPCAGVKLRVIHAKLNSPHLCAGVEFRVIHALCIPHTCVQVLNFVLITHNFHSVLFTHNFHSAHLCAGAEIRVIHALCIPHTCVQVLNFVLIMHNFHSVLFTHSFHSTHLCAGAELRACSGAGAQGEPPVH